jgi:hypothetical protein
MHHLTRLALAPLFLRAGIRIAQFVAFMLILLLINVGGLVLEHWFSVIFPGSGR